MIELLQIVKITGVKQTKKISKTRSIWFGRGSKMITEPIVV